MSSNHRIKPMDLRRRQPPKDYLLCRANGGKHMCSGIIEWECSFICEGPGKRHTRRLFMCDRHAYSFATKHGLMMPSKQARAQKMLKAMEEKMFYQIIHSDGRVERDFTLGTILNEMKRSFSSCWCRTYQGALCEIEDIELDDILASEVEIFREFPDKDQESIAVIKKQEDELEVTHVNGIAGKPKVTIEETEDDDGLGACQGYGGGRHG